MKLTPLLLSLALVLSACAHPQRDALHASSLIAAEEVGDVNIHLAIVAAQVDALYRPLSIACAKEPVCLERAKETLRGQLGERIGLADELRATQGKVADELEAGDRCGSDETCLKIHAAAAVVESAKVRVLLAKLRSTSPITVLPAKKIGN